MGTWQTLLDACPYIPIPLMAILFALAFGPLKAIARDHILGFVTLDDAMINRVMEACWDGIRR